MPTQEDIGRHLDLSQSAVSRLLKTLGLDGQNASLDEIRRAYLRHLREQAEGRAPTSQDELNRAKIREASANAELKELAFAEQAATLVPVAEFRDLMNTWATFGKAEAAAHFQQLVETIEQRYGVTVDPALIDERLAGVNKTLDDWPRPLGRKPADGAKAHGSE